MQQCCDGPEVLCGIFEDAVGGSFVTSYNKLVHIGRKTWFIFSLALNQSEKVVPTIQYGCCVIETEGPFAGGP